MLKGLSWDSQQNSVSGRFWANEDVVDDEGGRLHRMRSQSTSRLIAKSVDEG